MLFDDKGEICMNSEEKIKIELNKKIQSEVEELKGE